MKNEKRNREESSKAKTDRKPYTKPSFGEHKPLDKQAAYVYYYYYYL